MVQGHPEAASFPLAIAVPVLGGRRGVISAAKKRQTQ